MSPDTGLQAAHPPFRFFDLPPEIRNLVYHFVWMNTAFRLRLGQIPLVAMYGDWPTFSESQDEYLEESIQPRWIPTNRQFFYEAMEQFYLQAWFGLTGSKEPWGSDLDKWEREVSTFRELKPSSTWQVPSLHLAQNFTMDLWGRTRERVVNSEDKVDFVFNWEKFNYHRYNEQKLLEYIRDHNKKHGKLSIHIRAFHVFAPDLSQFDVESKLIFAVHGFYELFGKARAVKLVIGVCAMALTDEDTPVADDVDEANNANDSENSKDAYEEYKNSVENNHEQLLAAMARDATRMAKMMVQGQGVYLHEILNDEVFEYPDDDPDFWKFTNIVVRNGVASAGDRLLDEKLYM